MTPKYLSSVCKRASNKTASDWIEACTISRISIFLNNKSMTIKEVSEQINFSNQSFFGRYVQRILGVSPTVYRRSINSPETEK
ncbi:MAG: helix-turn-helix domain-containing protein [Bacteroidales bacterium]